MKHNVDWTKYEGRTFEGLDGGTSIVARVVSIAPSKEGLFITTEPLKPGPETNQSPWFVESVDIPEIASEDAEIVFGNGWKIGKL